jgi:hypothetical protein
MKKYSKPCISIINIDTISLLCKSHNNGHGNSNHDGWYNKWGEPWQPGDGPHYSNPNGNNAAEYRSNIWE